MDKEIIEPTTMDVLEALAILAAYLKCNNKNQLETSIKVDGDERIIRVECKK